MKKFNLIFVGVILFLTVGLTLAMIGISNLDNTKNLSRTQIDKILDRTNRGSSQGITRINIKIDDPDCTDSYCIFHAYQSEIINKRFKIPTSFKNCTLINKTLSSCEIEETIFYTDIEIRNLADDYIKEKLESYASASTERELRTKKSIGGKLDIV